MPITKADQNVIQTSICTTDTNQTITGSKSFSNPNGIFSGNVSSATALATGSTTARSLAERFDNVINVKDFGAKGDGVADDYAAIQAALDSFVDGTKTAVYFPQGFYLISNTLRVKTSYTGLFCDTLASAVIKLTNFSVEAAIIVKTSIPASIYAFSMFNLYIERGPSSTYQKGIILESCSNTHITDIEISGFPTCLDIRGGLNCHYTSIRLGDFGSTYEGPKLAALMLNASNYNPTQIFSFTHIFTNSFIGNVLIQGIDYITFTNCYMGSRSKDIGCVYIEDGGIYGNFNNNFDNCYFDCGIIDLEIEHASIIIKDGDKNSSKFTDCIWSGWGTVLKIDANYDPSIEMVGCLIIRCGKIVEVTASSDSYTSLILVGNQFRDCGFLFNDISIIDVKDVRQINVTGNNFYWDYAGFLHGGSKAGTKKVIHVNSGATVENMSITGNVFAEGSYPGVTFQDFVNDGTVDQLAITGNASDNPTNTIVGNVIGNKENTSPVSLDWYEEKNFNPELSFGGDSVGITYSFRTGSVTRIGNRVFFSLYFQLTNKGTSIGNAKISGLPFIQNSAQPSNYTINAGQLNAAIGDANLDAIQDGSTGIQPKKQSGGSSISLTDVDFTNSTFITITGTYSVA
jgi:hypothetical protein